LSRKGFVFDNYLAAFSINQALVKKAKATFFPVFIREVDFI